MKNDKLLFRLPFIPAPPLAGQGFRTEENEKPGGFAPSDD